MKKKLIPEYKKVWLRRTGEFVKLIGFGSRITGMCNVRCLSDGRVFQDVHYSQLNGNGLKVAFYGSRYDERTRKRMRLWEFRHRQKQKKEREDKL